MKSTYLKVDSRNRISLTKLMKDLPAIFRANLINGKIILEPIKEIPAEEAWIFEPENKHLLEKLIEGLKEEATIDMGSFKKYLEE